MSFAREVWNLVLSIDDDIIVEKGTPQEILFNAQNERTKLFLSKIL
jgi:ABC-type polar amino acid transport system ATPase subunit